MDRETRPAAPTSFFHLPSSGSWLCLSARSSPSPSGSSLPSQLRCTPASERKTSGVSVAGLGGKRQQVKCQEGKGGLRRRAPRVPLNCSSSSSCRSLLHPRLLLPDVQRLRLGRTEPHCPLHLGKLSITPCPRLPPGLPSMAWGRKEAQSCLLPWLEVRSRNSRVRSKSHSVVLPSSHPLSQRGLDEAVSSVSSLSVNNPVLQLCKQPGRMAAVEEGERQGSPK